MRSSRTNRGYTGRRPLRPAARPTVEALEERIPPGDVLLAGMLGKSWLAPQMTRFASAAGPVGGRTELPAVGYDQARPNSFFAAAGQNSPFRFILSADIQSRAGSTTDNPAGPANPLHSARSGVRPAFQDASGLTEETIDHLLGDDFDQLSSSANRRGLRKDTGAPTNGTQNPAPAQTGGAGGSPSGLAQGPGGPSMPSMPDPQNGGLTGGGGGAPSQGATGSSPSTPNLITGGHFANGSGPAGPFARATGVNAGVAAGRRSIRSTTAAAAPTAGQAAASTIPITAPAEVAPVAGETAEEDPAGEGIAQEGIAEGGRAAAATAAVAEAAVAVARGIS
jgi:hypothetical protein